MILLRGSSESGSLPGDGPGVSAVTDHPFVPEGEWWTRCRKQIVEPIDSPPFRRWRSCGLAEAAHAETTVGRDA